MLFSKKVNTDADDNEPQQNHFPGEPACNENCSGAICAADDTNAYRFLHMHQVGSQLTMIS